MSPIGFKSSGPDWCQIGPPFPPAHWASSSHFWFAKARSQSWNELANLWRDSVEWRAQCLGERSLRAWQPLAVCARNCLRSLADETQGNAANLRFSQAPAGSSRALQARFWASPIWIIAPPAVSCRAGHVEETRRGQNETRRGPAG